MMPVIKAVSSLVSACYLPAETDNWRQLLHTWQAWARQAPLGTGECRDTAVRRLRGYLIDHTYRLDLSGLALTALPKQFPAGLQHLDVSDNNLTGLPKNLPDSLKTLNVNYNELARLPANLPSELRRLDATCNCLTCLPDNLPAALTELNFSNNRLTYLPDRLPDSLNMLNCCHNQLVTLPAHLPMSLINLYVSNNELTDLSKSLSDALKILDVNDNWLTSLPVRLPTSLMHLYVSSNQLTHLPESLPDSLETLNANHNQLTHLPESLPDSLKTLSVNDNRLTSLPVRLPTSLIYLYARYNRLTHLPVTLPPSLRTLDVGNNPLDSGDQTPANFLAKLTCWHEGIDSGRWQSIYNEAHAGDFANFLGKLHRGKNRSSAALRGQVGRWLDYLAQDGHGELRQHTFVLAKEAMESCVDRASYYFTQMQTLQTEHQLLSRDASPEEVVKAILVNFRLQTLHGIATRQVAARRAVSPGFAEDLEIYLAYQYKLREPLALPVYAELQFSEIAGLTDDDIRQAKETVAEAEKADFMHYWLTKSALWEAILTKWDAEKRKAADDQYVEDITPDNCKFKAEVDKRLRDWGIAVNDADARQAVSDQLAKELLYAQRYQLSREYLAEKQALSLLEQCNSATL